MIRAATAEDLPAVLGMCRKFFAASEYADVTTYDPESMQRTVMGLIDGENVCLLVADDLSGMVAGIVYPFYFSTELCAQELFWWSESGHGRELLRAFEAWAAGKGASTVTMISLNSLGHGRVSKIYTRAGYRPSEQSWIKRFSDGN